MASLPLEAAHRVAHVADRFSQLEPHGTVPGVWSYVSRERSEYGRPVRLHMRVCVAHGWASDGFVYVGDIPRCGQCEAQESAVRGAVRYAVFTAVRDGLLTEAI